jgi:hypothetical protein
MAEANPKEYGPEPKRRKVRKGTQSCWECRQRKVRCIFAATTNTICENCRRRGTACNSQEYSDEPMLSAGSHQVGTRLGRVEQLVEHLVNSAVTTHIPNSFAKDLSESDLNQIESRQQAGHTSDRCADVSTPSAPEVEADTSFNYSDCNTVVRISRHRALTAILF